MNNIRLKMLKIIGLIIVLFIMIPCHETNARILLNNINNSYGNNAQVNDYAKYNLQLNTY